MRYFAIVHMNVNAQNGETPLHVAADKGHESFCRLLLKGGATVDPKNDVRSPEYACVHVR